MKKNHPPRTLLAIDPGTHELGWAVWKDQKPLTDGLFHIPWEAPSEFLRALNAFLDDAHALYKIDAVACERMFVNTQFGGKSAALLNVIPLEIEAWCYPDIPFKQIANTTVKKRVGGKGGAKKESVAKAVQQYLTEESAALPKEKRFNVTDAHAIAVTYYLLQK